MNAFLLALNHPSEAYRSGEKSAAWTLVAVTILINAVLEPLLGHFFGVSASALSAVHMLKTAALGAVTYAALCAALWLVCRLFGSGLRFSEHLGAWGVTFFPTALCALAVAFSETFFYVFWNGTVWGMLLSFLFVGILLWKLMLYIIYLREYAGLRGWRLFGAMASIGVIILLLAAFDGWAGVKSPVL